MKPFVKYAAVGLAGYLVGFYEMKYKATKSLLNVMTEKCKKDSEDKKKKKWRSPNGLFFFYL